MDKIIEAGHSNFYLVESDYSPIYLFFVNLLSMIPKGEMITVSGYTYSVNWITALKTCYFVFDLFNALAIYLIIHHATRSKGKATAGFLIMTALPIQFINSAIWGQADCIYTCFLLYSLYFALRGKSNLSFLMFGFALANKLQAVFLAPFLVYMILYRKIKFSSIIFTPIAVLSSFIPAYVCGASFTQPFTFYEKQFTGYTSLTSECPTFWQLFAFRNSRVETVRPGVVYMALLFIGVLFAIIWLRKVENTKENLLNIAAFLACATVFFLPYMHDRYFYLVDILVVLYAVSSGRRYSLIPLMQIASGMAYYKYISGKYFFDVLGKDSVHIPAFIV
jgi:Gpi18-like mannosyltransferase